MEQEIQVFAPATVANVGPGFDIFGFALEGIGDTLTIRQTDDQGLTISGGQHCENLPADPDENVAGVAVNALLKDSGKENTGLHIHIEKNIIPGSGLGSSASSASGAVFGVNELLGLGYSLQELIQFAMIGEGAGGGIPHADNVAPCLLGGFTIVRSYDPLDVIRLPHTPELYVAIVHPKIEVKTSVSKRMLKREIAMPTAVRQWGNVAGMITGLLTGDLDLIGRSMEDHVASPVRSMMIPGYEAVQEYIQESGALGVSISGSGPSLFAFCPSDQISREVGRKFGEIYEGLDIDHSVYLSKINPKGTTNEIR